MIESTLQKIGLNDKEIKIYLSCLKSGPSSVRKIADDDAALGPKKFVKSFADDYGAAFNFWHEILTQAKDNGIKRIFCCCLAGQGRTGTALASLLLATEMVDEPDIAIEYIRKNYNNKAIESKDQEEYIFDLIYQTAE